jgi:hypothetical protein
MREVSNSINLTSQRGIEDELIRRIAKSHRCAVAAKPQCKDFEV